MRKIISLVMAFIMTIGAIAVTNETKVYANDEITVKSKDMNMAGYFIYGTGETQPLRTKIDYYNDKSGTERMAYCIEPKKSGVSELGSYAVDASSYSNDPVIWGILLNGYPNKSASDMGVSDDFQAYYVTKMALWMHLEYGIMSSWRTVGSSYDGLLSKTKQLYTKGKTYTTINKSQYVMTSETTEAVDDGDYKSQTFTVTSDTTSKPFTIALDGTQPSGTIITDVNGIEKTSFILGEKFKMSIPKDKITERGNFIFTINGDLKTCLVLKGIPSDNNKQSYALQTEYSTENAKSSVSYRYEETDKKPSTLQIYKLEAGKKNPTCRS